MQLFVNNLSYSFELGPQRREAAFFHALFLTYPGLVGKYLFARRPLAEKIFYLVFSPLLALRNLANGIMCTFPFCLKVPYKLTLHDNHLSFGPDHERAQMANRYGSIKAVFRADKQWCVLLHDGYIAYLPPDKAGELAFSTIKTHLTPARFPVTNEPERGLPE